MELTDEQIADRMLPPKQVRVDFFIDAIEDARLSAQFNKPPSIDEVNSMPDELLRLRVDKALTLYRDEVFVRVLPVGERDHICVVATEAHKQEYPKEWAEFCQRVERMKSTFPLRCLPWLTPSVSRNFQALGIENLDQLAAYEGDFPTPAYQEYRTWAKSFINHMRGKKAHLKLIDGKYQEVA